MNLTQKFMMQIAACPEPQLFLGVARILKVKLVSETEKDEEGHALPREFADIFADVMAAYDAAGRKRKKELLKILTDANNTQGAG